MISFRKKIVSVYLCTHIKESFNLEGHQPTAIPLWNQEMHLGVRRSEERVGTGRSWIFSSTNSEVFELK